VVDSVSFALRQRETLGLVGESGAGKSTIGRAILGLAPVYEGEVIFDRRPITRASYRARRALSADLQVVFQDPYGSLNPTRTIGQTLAEPLAVHRTDGDTHARIKGMLERVGLPADAANRYPAHFSGGQRQRIAIARALIVEPRVVICDEPVSALDLSVQAQVLNLLTELQNDLAVSYLFVAHDLAVVRHISHRIIVLYRGRVMEEGPAEVIYGAPRHPYTRTLLDAIPIPDPVIQAERRKLRGRRPIDRKALPLGDSCVFSHRCPHAAEICTMKQPMLETTPKGAEVACHRWRELPDHESPAVGDVR
jgi:oligopeptide/dipeptide ABC transporter ATP-binding protein